MTLSEQFDDRSMSPEPVKKTKIQASQKRFQNKGQSLNELENGPSSFRQKGIYFEWVFLK